MAEPVVQACKEGTGSETEMADSGLETIQAGTIVSVLWNSGDAELKDS